jgi:hypothetical protein
VWVDRVPARYREQASHRFETGKAEYWIYENQVEPAFPMMIARPAARWKSGNHARRFLAGRDWTSPFCAVRRTTTSYLTSGARPPRGDLAERLELDAGDGGPVHLARLPLLSGLYA